MKTRVVHCKRDKYNVYIGRPSKWQNPFKIGKDGTRLEVIEKFRDYAMNNPKLIKEAKKELRGKILGCWCRPKVCHGDVWIEIVDGEEAPLAQ